MKKEVDLEIRKLDELARRLKPLIVRRLQARKHALVRQQSPRPSPQQDASATVRYTINPQAAGKERPPEHRERRNALLSWVRRWLRWL